MADDSIFDKMIEMGMGMTIANQIPRMMNSVMPDQTPPATPPQMPTTSLQAYACIDNKQVGGGVNSAPNFCAYNRPRRGSGPCLGFFL